MRLIPRRLNLPTGWAAAIRPARWKKPFGWCFQREKRVEVYPPKWIPPIFGLRDLAIRLTENHEVLHAWGNPGCSNMWCLGFEGSKLKEYLAFPFQALAGFRFCSDCLCHHPKPATYAVFDEKAARVRAGIAVLATAGLLFLAFQIIRWLI